jgi:hypothetical protein
MTIGSRGCYMPTYTFSEDQKAAINQFRDHLVFILAVRNTFETLYEDAAHVHILAASAEAFFGDLSSILHNYLILAYARLTDPFDANHKNFTIEYLYKMQSWIEPEKSRLALLMKEMTTFRSYVVLARSKIIAHNDLKAYLTPGTVIGGFPKGADFEFLTNVQNFVQLLYEQAYGTTYGDIVTTMPGHALDLIKLLRMGLAMNRMMQEEKDAGRVFEIDSFIDKIQKEAEQV